MTDKESDEFFVRLFLDTEPFGSWSALDMYFRGELIIQKPWTGTVSKDRTAFKVRRTRTGIFKTGISMFEICDKLTLINNESVIDIKIRPVWYVVLNLIGLIVFFGLITWNLFNDMTGWIVCISLVMLQILFLILDLNKTDESLIDYLDHRSTQI